SSAQRARTACRANWLILTLLEPIRRRAILEIRAEGSHVDSSFFRLESDNLDDAKRAIGPANRIDGTDLDWHYHESLQMVERILLPGNLGPQSHRSTSLPSGSCRRSCSSGISP